MQDRHFDEIGNDQESLALTIDRLVDGELAGNEYRRALARLDDHPEAWRRCALAFLESQALSMELREARAAWEAPASPLSTKVEAPSTSLATPLVGGFRARRAMGLLLTCAASFGLALIVGLSMRGDFAGSSRPAGSEASLAEAQGVTGELSEPLPSHGGKATTVDAAPPFREPRPSGEYRFAADGGQDQAPREFDLPIYDGRDLNERELAAWIARQEPRESSRLIDLIRKAGHGVRTRRGLAPIDMQDGQQAFAPTLEVEITPAAREIQ